jgi:hypothetical protein
MSSLSTWAIRISFKGESKNLKNLNVLTVSSALYNIKLAEVLWAEMNMHAHCKPFPL